jgi:hypothetical protein
MPSSSNEIQKGLQEQMRNRRTVATRLSKPDDTSVAEKGNGSNPSGELRKSQPSMIRTANPMEVPQRPRNSDSDELKDKPYYSDEAQLRMINLTFDPLASALFKENGIDPDEAHLMGLTRINNSREAMMWAQGIAKEAAFNRYVNGVTTTWPVSKIRRVTFLIMRRSLPMVMGGGFVAAVNVAQEQTITKGEEASEESSW